MAVMEYIGARYVPKIYEGSNGSEWESGVEYEALTIVTYNSNSYTSRKPVPSSVGNPSDNIEYWAQTGSYNAQVNQLTNEVADLSGRVDTIEGIVGQVFPPVNIMTLGAKNDGSEDVGAIINQYTSQFPIYLPVGRYLVTTPIVLVNSLLGADCGSGRAYISNSKTSVLVNSITSGSIITINENAIPHTITMSNIDILGNNQDVTAIDFKPAVRVQLNIRNVGIAGVKIGLDIAPSVTAPALVRIDGFRLYGIYDETQQAAIMDSIGIRNNANSVDNHFINVDIFGYRVGMQLMGNGGHLLNMINIYPPNGSVSAENKDQYFAGTACVEAYGNITADMIYLDTSYQCWIQRTGYAQIGKAFTWFDGWDASGVSVANGLCFSTRTVNGVTSRIMVESYFVGGDPRAIEGICGGEVIIKNLKNMTTRQGTAAENKKWQLPIGKFIKESACQYSYIPNGHFFACARIPLGNYGTVVFSVSFGAEYAELQILINSVLAVTSLKKLNTPAYNYYYKVDGSCAIIYMEFPGSGTMGAVDPTVVPTRSALPTSTKTPVERICSSFIISANSLATVVFAVPGFPVNTMCIDTLSRGIPFSMQSFLSL